MGVFLASLLEATIVPIPLEALLIPAMVAQPTQIWRMTFAALLACFIGAALWYAAGYWFSDGIGVQLAEWSSSKAEVEAYRQKIRSNGFWIVFAGGLTPTPFQIVCFVAGAAEYSIPLFVLSSVASRSLRYCAVAWLAYALGDHAHRWWRNHKLAVALGSIALLAALYFISRGLQSVITG